MGWEIISDHSLYIKTAFICISQGLFVYFYLQFNMIRSNRDSLKSQNVEFERFSLPPLPLSLHYLYLFIKFTVLKGFETETVCPGSQADLIELEADHFVKSVIKRPCRFPLLYSELRLGMIKVQINRHVLKSLSCGHPPNLRNQLTTLVFYHPPFPWSLGHYHPPLCASIRSDFTPIKDVACLRSLLITPCVFLFYYMR